MKYILLKYVSLTEHLSPVFQEGPGQNSNNNEKHPEYALLLNNVHKAMATRPWHCLQTPVHGETRAKKIPIRTAPAPNTAFYLPQATAE